MQQTRIINSNLQKPWLLIACYEVSFDNYINIQNKLERLYQRMHKSKESALSQTETYIFQLRKQLENISQNLRGIDEMIHDYIKTHQK